MTQQFFAPGCAFMLYKPELVVKVHAILNENLGKMDMSLLCCTKIPKINVGTQVINVCPGCDKRYRENYPKSTTISLWEILATSDFFPFPDYHGKRMSIIDACPTRDQARIHDAIRILLKKMNIILVEPKKTRDKGTCCGDSFWGKIPVDKVKKQMKKRTSEMPVDDVVVYCVSCSKSVFVGRKKPRYMIDLLFNEETIPKIYEPEQWHKVIDDFIEKH